VSPHSGSRPLPARIATGPLYRVGRERTSMVLRPLAMRLAHGWRTVRTRMMLSIIGRSAGKSSRVDVVLSPLQTPLQAFDFARLFADAITTPYQ
jgi:hypothetical protein